MNLIIAWLQKILFSQSVIDVTQDVKLGLRHWLSSLGRIGVVKHRKALRRLVRHHEDIPRPVARVVILQQVFRMNPAGNQSGTSQRDGLGVASQVLFQVGPTVDEILPRLQLHRRVSCNGAERGVVAVPQHRVPVKVAVIVLAHAFHIVHDPAVLRLADAVVQLLFRGNIVLNVIEIILADRSVVGSADIQVEAGVFRRTAREKPPENQSGSLRD